VRHNAFPIYHPSLKSHGEIAAELVELEDHEDITAIKLQLIRAERTSAYFSDSKGRNIPPPAKYSRPSTYTHKVAVDSITPSSGPLSVNTTSALISEGLLSVGSYHKKKYTPKSSARTLHLLRNRKNRIF
jgi:hypothetical protein